jgi:FkbM family methyltransferase
MDEKYNTEKQLFEIKNYHNDDNIYFSVFSNCPLSNVLKSGEIYESHLHKIFEKYINKESIVIEGGCHIGSHSVKLSKLSGKLYCFEPLPESNKLLQKNLILNNCYNVIVSSYGLSDKISQTKFGWIPLGNLGGSGLLDNPMGKPDWINTDNEDIDVELITIDSLNLDKLDFIKLDVEGYEPKVINGALDTIKKCKPVITVECWSNHYGGVDYEYTKNTFNMLIDIGYSLTQIENSDWLFLPKL